MNVSVVPDPPEDDVDTGHGLFRRKYADGTDIITNIRLAGTPRNRGKAGSGLIGFATGLLFLLAIGLFAVSLNAQYTYVFHVKHQSAVSLIEAISLDAGMAIFSLLALGLARAGKAATIERALVMVCALGSAGMNYAAANVVSPRSIAAYVVPPIFLAIVVDRVVAVVRRHVLGDEERSPWTPVGKAALYLLRFAVAPPSTAQGARRALLNATPLPEAPAEQKAVEASPERKAIEQPRAKTQRKQREQGPSKTQLFLTYVAEEYGNGDIANIKPDAVYGISKLCSPKFELNSQSAGNALRKAIKRAKGEE